MLHRMIRYPLTVFVALFGLAVATAFGQTRIDPLVQRHWFETRTAHFNIYSCAATQDVFKLSARLEQFRDAYSLLAGAQAVTSPPIMVMAFPDVEAMQPFLPLYQGKPANLAGFFRRDSDENLIVLAFSGTNSTALDVIFHEYTHLLLRHNDLIWPLWLKEGMAEIYSTFEATGHEVRVGKPISHHLRILREEPPLPLAELFAVSHDSPHYNEREHQGMFYAESWLLTHYLMQSDNPARKAQFTRLTVLLRQGQTPEQAFTNAFRTSLPVMQNELRRYLERGQFTPVDMVVKADLSAPRALTTRGIAPAETCFQLGNELLRIGQLDTAEVYFLQAKKFAPTNPLPYEGLGLLAAEREKPAEAVLQLRESLQRGSGSFHVHYTYAKERYHLTADAQDRYTHLDKEAAAEIQNEIQKSISLMPSFGPAYELLGFFEMVQGDNLAEAESHLQKAIQLEPENQSYLLTLAQAQIIAQDGAAARQTLAPLRATHIDAKLRARAEEMIQEIGRQNPAH
ncbi:MAG: repeat-containing protein [Pedosphaera sp.]|nr:repeat-containing protein [Pedosphaera sp.]